MQRPATATQNPAANNATAKSGEPLRRRLRPAARPPRHEMTRDVGEQRPVDRVRRKALPEHVRGHVANGDVYPDPRKKTREVPAEDGRGV